MSVCVQDHFWSRIRLRFVVIIGANFGAVKSLFRRASLQRCYLFDMQGLVEELRQMGQQRDFVNDQGGAVFG